MKKATAIRNYRRFTGAEEYIVGFIYKHNLYAIQVAELMPRWMVMKAESSRHAEKLQMSLKAKHKRELINKGAELICTEEEFLQMNDLRNKGFTFERLVFDLNGQGAEWSRDNVRFDKCGDININGVEIQIKFENAQIVTVPTIKKLQKEYRQGLTNPTPSVIIKIQKRKGKVNKMRTVSDVPVMKNEDWRDTPPQYDNLSDTRTVEWAIAEELTEVTNEFEILRALTNEVNNRFVGGIQQGAIKDWEQVAEMIEEWKEIVEQRLEAITDRFY